ncbi:O-antigen/teichoic acid export membrane protein [Arthrobacter sp. UYCu511]|uniref:oligosaccharide flippase family protein n=1 Tax=Arthrobacter sp. UYCu511 TaxID=3156337 RepID=UPI0033926E19
MKRPIKLLAGFSGSALIAGISSLVTIPMLVAGIGSQPWALIAASQALGTIIAVLVQLGWGATGTAEVAAMPCDKHFAFYSKSVQYRCLAFLLSMTALTLWIVLTQLSKTTTTEWNFFVIVGFAATGLSANWFFVGTKNPTTMLISDAIPRAFITVTGSICTMFLGNIWAYNFAIILGALLPVFFSSYLIAKKYGKPIGHYFIWDTSTDRRVLIEQLPGLGTALVATVYKQLPLLILASITPAAAAPFALIDRIYKFALAGLRPISQLLQTTIPAKSAVETAIRARSRIPKMLALSMLFAIGYLMFVFTFGETIGSNSIRLSPSLIALSSLALLMSFTNQWLGMGALVALNGKHELLLAVTIGASICAIIVFPLISNFYSIGAILSIAVAETIIFLVQIICVRKRYNAVLSVR